MFAYFNEAFKIVHERLMTKKTYDTHLSGSTVCAVLFDGVNLYCSNAGDSRAVLYSNDQEKNQEG